MYALIFITLYGMKAKFDMQFLYLLYIHPYLLLYIHIRRISSPERIPIAHVNSVQLYKEHAHNHLLLLVFYK
jgi:hypothetical protein